MYTTRPAAVTVVFLLVLLQIAIGVTASVIAAFAPADYKTYAVTIPVFLVVLFATVAYYLWVGRPWARAVTMVVAALAVIGDLSVVLYYDHTATMTTNHHRADPGRGNSYPAATAQQQALLPTSPAVHRVTECAITGRRTSVERAPKTKRRAANAEPSLA